MQRPRTDNSQDRTVPTTVLSLDNGVRRPRFNRRKSPKCGCRRRRGRGPARRSSIRPIGHATAGWYIPSTVQCRSLHAAVSSHCVVARPSTQTFSGTAIKPPYFGTRLSPTRLVMRPTSAPIITPPESGCQENAAMKAPVADAAGKDASPSGAARDTHAPIIVLVGHARQVPSRPPDHQLPIRHGHNVRRRSPTGVSKRVDHRLSAADGDRVKLDNMSQLRRQTCQDDERHPSLGIRILAPFSTIQDRIHRARHVPDVVSAKRPCSRSLCSQGNLLIWDECIK